MRSPNSPAWISLARKPIRGKPFTGNSTATGTFRRHLGVSLPSSVMNLRRFTSDIAFEDRLADQYEDGGEMCSFVMVITDTRSASATLELSDDQVR